MNAYVDKENPMDEESHPLSSQPKRVAEAYASNSSKNTLKKFGFCILVFVVLSILASGSGTDTKDEKSSPNLRNPVESEHDSTPIVHQEEVVNIPESEVPVENESAIPSDDEVSKAGLEQEMEAVMEDVDEAEEEEIEINDSKLVTAIKGVEDNLKFYLGKVFGSSEEEDDDDDDDVSEGEGDKDEIKVTEQQLDLMASKISEKLEADVKKEFRDKADAIAEEKIDVIDQVVKEDRDQDMNAEKIAGDVEEAEKEVLEDLKDEIDEAATKVEKSIPDKVKEIRNDVVKEVTGKTLDDIVSKKHEKAKKKKEKLKELKKIKTKVDQDNEENKKSLEDESTKQTVESVKNETQPALNGTENTVTDEIPAAKVMPTDDESSKELPSKSAERSETESGTETENETEEETERSEGEANKDSSSATVQN